jgi:surface protein
MFLGASKVNPDVSNWDLTNVTSIAAMFNSATLANPDVSNWNTAKIQNMSGAFRNSAFKRDLSHFKINALTNATNMLTGVNINETGTTTRYDALLVAWAAYTPKNTGVTFNGGTSKYSLATGKPARDILTGAPNNWIITDGGLA